MGEEFSQPDYDKFEADWKRKHRSSIPRRVRASSVREFFWIGFWIVVATGAAIFSAAHTIPAAELTIFKTVTARSQLAITAFVIVELVIFGAAAGRREIKWLGWLLAGSVLVALAGNIGSSVRAVSENGGDLLNQFGGVLLSIIAPITALAAGEVLHIQLDKRNAKINEAQEDYEERVRETEAKVNQAYAKYIKEQEKSVRKANSVNSVNERSEPARPSEYSVNSANGYTKQMNSREIISEFFERHPEFRNMTLDQLNDAIATETGYRVGRTSIHNVRKEWHGVSVNGNGHHE